ncbi:hypothetical protein LOS15_10725 [Halomonas sp. 7T]|uniref:hypothetical protein n=1 Tax=Halomonas sp. 7T TaxID=2893469 RepID=UPI0021DB0296|nr:hypothetical protein [Halomonas sp. 7T]UXZ53312.1 hypothetical protein LOS15_10725 [Halomonas sp. 7T]
MSGQFDPSTMMQTLQGFSGLGTPNYEPPPIHVPDNRSRAEVREDFEKKLEQLDFAALEELKEKTLDTSEPEEFIALKDELEDSLVKFLRFYRTFEDLNSEESRKVALKEKELKLEAKHDWASKFRLFFFRILASALLVFTLFGIGYIEHQYDWARLPMTKYFSPNVTQP